MLGKFSIWCLQYPLPPRFHGKRKEREGERETQRETEIQRDGGGGGDISSVEPVVSSGLSHNRYIKRESLLQVGFALSEKTVPEADGRHQQCHFRVVCEFSFLLIYIYFPFV